MMGTHLGINFSSILVDLGGQVGAKLGSQSEKNLLKKAFKNRCEKEGDKIDILGGLGAVLESILD